jgi:hypothetical protein
VYSRKRWAETIKIELNTIAMRAPRSYHKPPLLGTQFSSSFVPRVLHDYERKERGALEKNEGGHHRRCCFAVE